MVDDCNGSPTGDNLDEYEDELDAEGAAEIIRYDAEFCDMLVGSFRTIIAGAQYSGEQLGEEYERDCREMFAEVVRRVVLPREVMLRIVESGAGKTLDPQVTVDAMRRALLRSKSGDLPTWKAAD